MDKKKSLSLMRFWLFGTFLIVTVAATLYAGVAVGVGLEIFKQLNYWIAVLVTAVLCALVYYIYKWYLDQDKG